jgi:hypothetical protein
MCVQGPEMGHAQIAAGAGPAEERQTAAST